MQFEGTRTESAKKQMQESQDRTSESGLFTLFDVLFWVWVAHGGHFLRAAIARVERRVVESTVADKTFLVGRHSIANLLADVGSRALERLKRVQLGDRNWVANPCEELFSRDNPDYHCN